MAKSKRSTALYEVISASRQSPRPSRIRQSTFWSRAQRWWSKPRPAPLPTESLAREAVVDARPPVQFSEPEPPVNLPVVAAQAEAPAKPIDYAIDPERRQIALHLSYRTAMMACAGLVVIVVSSVIVGKYWNRSNLPLLAHDTTDELRKTPAHREVLDLPRHVASNEETTATVASHTTTPNSQTSADLSTNPKPDSAEQIKRRAGLNYVIIQSYPIPEQKMATDAAAFLNSRGVSCTVEQDISGYLKFCVVGLDGFTRQSSPEFKSYVERIQQLSTEYGAKGTRNFKRFAPVAKKWDKQD
jgi:hypothetical protein